MSKKKHTATRERDAIIRAAKRASRSIAIKLQHITEPIMFVKNGEIVRAYKDGRKETVKKLQRDNVKVPKLFKLD